MTTYTKEQKTAYFKDLREQWAAVKRDLTEEKLTVLQAVIKAHGLNVSAYSYAFTLAAMRHAGLDGIPYLDCKTFKGWTEAGFRVRRGEHSKVKGITWIGIKDKDGDEDRSGGVFPKEYHLFHRSQVEAIAA